MKKAIVLVLLAAMCCLCGCGASQVTQGGVTYELSGGEAALVRFAGGANDVTVPDEVSGCAVTSIAQGAFTSAKGLTSVSLPQGLRTVGDYAFAKCTALVQVTFRGESLTSLGEGAFAACHALGEVTLPQGLQAIGKEAFSDCRALTRVSIPGTVTSIGARAFSQCALLGEVQLPPGLTELGEHVFAGCASVRLIVFEGTVGEEYARQYELPYELED